MNKYMWLAGALLATMALSEGKPPEFWCRAEPVSPNGDDYLRYALSQAEACDHALEACAAQYRNCEITGCGEWFTDAKLLDGFCLDSEDTALPSSTGK